ncbi:hypothetical protein LDENG_00184830 [Lucifuga dentata]|nr:hypothetical protein LDENG_00184830 [Lucifuga dentata]
MKCFERLVLKHIQASFPPSFNPHQFAYRTNRSTEDAISITLHTALSHLEHRNSYVRMLFVDYSSTFNTIIPDILINKLSALGLSSLTCRWINDFLVGSHLSSTITLSTSSPQGCVLSPFLYSLYTYDCSPAFSTNSIIKFADDTTVIGLISGRDESAYRQEVQKLSEWYSINNLTLNTTKTKELIIDFRKHNTNLRPLLINGECVEYSLSNSLAYTSQTASHGPQTPQQSHQKSPAALTLPEDTQEEQLEREPDGVFLQSHYREHPDVLHFSVVHWVLSNRQKGFPENHKDCRNNHWLSPPLPNRHC